jgi:hypothetical protein
MESIKKCGVIWLGRPFKQVPLGAAESWGIVDENKRLIPRSAPWCGLATLLDQALENTAGV